MDPWTQHVSVPRRTDDAGSQPTQGGGGGRDPFPPRGTATASPPASYSSALRPLGSPPPASRLAGCRGNPVPPFHSIACEPVNSLSLSLNSDRIDTDVCQLSRIVVLSVFQLDL
jgi:hypothetical protein